MRMGRFLVLFFCIVNSGLCFSESSIMSPINPNDDELHAMIVKGETKEMIRIVPTVVTNFTANDVQGSLIASSTALAESDANITTEAALINSIDTNNAYESLTQPLINPKINDLVGDDEMKNFSTTINSTTVDVQGSLNISSITTPTDIESDKLTVTAATINVTEYFIDASGPLARLLIRQKIKVDVPEVVISSTSTTSGNKQVEKSTTLHPTTVNSVTIGATNSPVNKTRTGTAASSNKAIEKIKTWASEVAHFFNNVMSRLRNIFHRKH